jgi:hypothetical protein
MLTQQQVRELFAYHEDGILTWLISPVSRVRKGQVAGCLHSNGYHQVHILRKLYPLHRVIYLWHNNCVPKYIDHIDLDKTNNRIHNLRPATAQQNQANTKINPRNTSGFKGVTWNINAGLWKSAVTVNGKCKHLGYFSSPEKAHEAYCSAAKATFGEFYNPG